MARGKKQSLEARLKAAMAYIMTSSSEKAARLCDVPARTIREWSEQDWWADLIAEAKRRKNDELDAGLTSVIHRGVVETMDRMEKGNFVKDKDGSLQRKPVDAREAAWVVGVFTDKRSALRGDPTRITRTISTQERLKELNEGLKKQARSSYVPDDIDLTEADNPPDISLGDESIH